MVIFTARKQIRKLYHPGDRCLHLLPPRRRCNVSSSSTLLTPQLLVAVRMLLRTRQWLRSRGQRAPAASAVRGHAHAHARTPPRSGVPLPLASPLPPLTSDGTPASPSRTSSPLILSTTRDCHPLPGRWRQQAVEQHRGEAGALSDVNRLVRRPRTVHSLLCTAEHRGRHLHTLHSSCLAHPLRQDKARGECAVGSS